MLYSEARHPSLVRRGARLSGDAMRVAPSPWSDSSQPFFGPSFALTPSDWLRKALVRKATRQAVQAARSFERSIIDVNTNLSMPA